MYALKLILCFKAYSILKLCVQIMFEAELSFETELYFENQSSFNT